MKKLLFLLILSQMVLSSVSAADQKYLPSQNDANVIHENISKKVEVVFYRLDGAEEYIPTVKVNDTLVGSLMPNTYAKTFTCDKNIKVGVAVRGDYIDTTNSFAISEDDADTVFIQAVERSDHTFFLKHVKSDSAKEQISRFEHKSNVINRYVSKCSSNIVQKSFDLKTDILFASNSSYFSPDGRIVLNEVLGQLKQSIVTNTGHITVSGYADRMGEEQYNQFMSEKRAKRVADYLRSKGITLPITTQGYGESKPVTRNCNQTNEEELKQCLSPDRRVVIELYKQ
jgi:outer membrane protein OmpA-like peptidoglycan-associated protein